MRKLQKGRPKPENQAKLISIKGHKRLTAKKAKEAKEARTSALFMHILGGVMMAGTIYIWYSKYKVVPMSGLAMVCGIVLAGILKAVFPDGLDSSNKLQKIVFLIFTGVIMSFLINRSTAGFAMMLLFSLTSAVYLFGVMKSFPDSKPQSS